MQAIFEGGMKGHNKNITFQWYDDFLVDYLST